MNVYIIIALVCVVAMAWSWLKKPVFKGAPARTWPASRIKRVAKPNLTQVL
jgi:hypothetical protein